MELPSISLPKISTSKLWLHGSIWIVFLVLLILLDKNPYSLGLSVLYNGSRLMLYGVLIYINLNYLIPKYLNTNKLTIYFAGLLILALVATPLGTLVQYLLLVQYPQLQSHIQVQQGPLFLISMVFLIFSTSGKIIVDWFKQQQTMRDLETQNMQSELKFLKAQINPHFLFNTLNSLYALTIKKSDQAPEIVIKLSEMMRYMLYECNERRVSLEKEVNYIQNYLDLEALRQSNLVDIDFKVNGKVDHLKIAPLVFIPFLENSFKHGVNHQLSDAYVYVTLNVSANKIDFIIENSKSSGLPVILPKPQGGIGLINVRRRLELIYPGEHSIDIDDQHQAYTVHLSLNLDS
ncbi:MAG: sensor histidine kinase [Saprospiraceae bacterium]|nr:sensor histidine kinase [Saprospiraceae bacterium]